MAANHKRSGRKPTRNRPGPAPLTPSKDDLRRVELGIAGGLSAASLARVFDMPVTTFKRAYAEQIETGRTRVMLDTLMCLDKESRHGSTAAAKALLGLIERASAKPAEAEPDKWANFAENYHARMANSDVSEKTGFEVN